MTYEFSTIYMTGRRGSLAAIHICDYGDRIVASAEKDKATFLQIEERLQQEYPDFNFAQTFQKGCTGTIFVRGEK